MPGANSPSGAYFPTGSGAAGRICYRGFYAFLPLPRLAVVWTRGRIIDGTAAVAASNTS